MPTYTFYNDKTKEEWTEICSLSQRLDILKEDNITQVPVHKKGGGIVAGVGASMKPSEGFRDILREIKKVTPGNNINII